MTASRGHFVDNNVQFASTHEMLHTNDLRGDTGSPAEWETSNGLSEEQYAPMPDWNIIPLDWTPPQANHVKHAKTSDDISSLEPPTLGFSCSKDLSESHDGAQSHWLSLSTPESDLLYGLSSFEDSTILPRGHEPCHYVSELLSTHPDHIVCSVLQAVSTDTKSISESNSSVTHAVPYLQQSTPNYRAAKSTRNRRLVKQDRPFHCTFCTDSFKTKYDWSRHEKSRHFNLEYWVCTPRGGIEICALSGQRSCAYCNMPEPSQAHLQSHNDGLCKINGQSKFFNRRDHLIQHLRHVHDLSDMISSLDDWKIAGPALVSQCGFCSQIMESWGERVDHLAKHFKQGKTREDWHGDLGVGSWHTIEGVEVQ